MVWAESQLADHVLNLYDVEANTFGSPDVTLVGDTVGPIRGSLVVTANRLRFLATGGPLAADNYTVVLRSGDNALRDLDTGDWLDGDGDGASGGDFTTWFTVAPPDSGSARRLANARGCCPSKKVRPVVVSE